MPTTVPCPMKVMSRVRLCPFAVSVATTLPTPLVEDSRATIVLVPIGRIGNAYRPAVSVVVGAAFEVETIAPATGVTPSKRNTVPSIEPKVSSVRFSSTDWPSCVIEPERVAARFVSSSRACQHERADEHPVEPEAAVGRGVACDR